MIKRFEPDVLFGDRSIFLFLSGGFLFQSESRFIIYKKENAQAFLLEPLKLFSVLKLIKLSA